MSEKLKQTFTNGTTSRSLKISIVGGGLVGSLAAIHLGQKGLDVNLYEFRDDIRRSELVAGRSINLALSARGRKALAEVGLEEELLKHGIPMKGRMLHDIKGNRTISLYDKNTDQCIYSVGRKYLNEVLLNAAERYPNIHLNFNQKLISAQFEDGQANFLNPVTHEITEVKSDLFIGCDGAFSAVRKHMMSKSRFDYSQTYIEHGYIELCIPSTLEGEFAMPVNYLHIWPRGKFMMIALPNQDRTWTVTLFMPFENFDNLDTNDKLLEFFQAYFPDSIPLIGKERLIKDFFKIQAQNLVMVKCRPYHIGSKVLLMGDAAHAMVPFYGQGMNAGFEDCTVLSNIMNQEYLSIESILKEFSQTRWEDAHSICDLAMYNYTEMRDLVNKKSYRLRKILDEFLYKIFPAKWVPLYNSVSFTRMPYKMCIENRKWQDQLLSRAIFTSGFVFLGVISIASFKLMRHRQLSIESIINLFNKIK